ncbi:hypothetical protein FRC12_001754 [Ceratobasidium sp. 428]|nr:hypothetical protein FRC12_001754 [Ceratobasidium sp. 428]
MSCNTAYSYSPPLILDENEVLHHFDSLLSTVIAHSRDHYWTQSGGVPDATATGTALCLYYAAMESDSGYPSVLITHPHGGIARRLQYNTCPLNFRVLFQRWADAVSRIHELSEYQRAELENVVHNGVPLPFPPAVRSSFYPPSGYDLPHSPVHGIAETLHVLARDISSCRQSRMQQHRVHSMPFIDTSSPWATPVTASPVNEVFYPQAQPGNSNFGYLRTDSPPHSYTLPASYSPAPSTASTPLYSPVWSPGSTNDQGVPVGGFLATPERGITLPTPGSATFRMPSPQPFNSRGSSPIENQQKRFTIANPDDTLVRSHDFTSSTNSTVTMISSNTSKLEIMNQLYCRGCKDLSGRLDYSSFSPRAISRGGFGEVYFGALRDGMRVAVKIMYAHETYEESKHLKYTAREVHTWSKCNHPNVARLMGTAEFHGQLAMVSQWMENGNLRNYISKNPSANRLKLCAQIADGLQYLHSIQIVHGDLKGANVLISHDGDPILIDFGNATQSCASLQFTKNGTNLGMTMRWAVRLVLFSFSPDHNELAQAPEIFENGDVSNEADVYALGMTILETFTGKHPYDTIKNDPSIVKTVVADKKIPDRPPEIPEDNMSGNMLWELLVNCWSHKPSERPTALSVHQSLKKILEGSQLDPSLSRSNTNFET